MSDPQQTKSAKHDSDSYAYSDALGRSPTPVREFIQEWLSTSSPEEVENRPLLYAVINGGTNAFKMHPKDAEYQPAKSEQTCGNCKSWWIRGVSKRNICSQINRTLLTEEEKDDTGGIRLDYWCKLWQSLPGNE